MIQLNTEGLISDFGVMVRPAKGLEAVATAMAQGDLSRKPAGSRRVTEQLHMKDMYYGERRESSHSGMSAPDGSQLAMG